MKLVKCDVCGGIKSEHAPRFRVGFAEDYAEVDVCHKCLEAAGIWQEHKEYPMRWPMAASAFIDGIKEQAAKYDGANEEHSDANA